MAERHDVLDQAIQAILDGATEVSIPRELEALVAIAADLRDLPDPEFKRRLGGRMTTTASEVREVTPYLVVEDVDDLIDFAKTVFEAKETLRTKGGAGGTHCEIHIGDSKLMMGGGMKLPHGPNLATLHVFVPDVDAAFERAIAAGATSLYGLVDQEYGSREGSVRDRWGNEWYIATERGEHYRPKNTKDVMPYLHPHGAPKMLEFLESALGAEVLEKYEHGGAIVHAKVRVGGSIVELGEAHGEWQPVRMMFVVAVDSADEAFARAVSAGATALDKPAKQPYGRRGAVEDPFGNQWHFMSEQ
jgi:PhnB protein